MPTYVVVRKRPVKRHTHRSRFLNELEYHYPRCVRHTGKRAAPRRVKRCRRRVASARGFAALTHPHRHLFLRGAGCCGGKCL